MHKHMIGLILNGLKVHAALTSACVIISNDTCQLVTGTTNKDRYLRVKVSSGACGGGNRSTIPDNSLLNVRGRWGEGSTATWHLDIDRPPSEVDPNKSAPVPGVIGPEASSQKSKLSTIIVGRGVVVGAIFVGRGVVVGAIVVDRGVVVRAGVGSTLRKKEFDGHISIHDIQAQLL